MYQRHRHDNIGAHDVHADDVGAFNKHNIRTPNQLAVSNSAPLHIANSYGGAVQHANFNGAPFEPTNAYGAAVNITVDSRGTQKSSVVTISGSVHYHPDGSSGFDGGRDFVDSPIWFPVPASTSAC